LLGVTDVCAKQRRKGEGERREARGEREGEEEGEKVHSNLKFSQARQSMKFS
jgi:hypothetical protein